LKKFILIVLLISFFVSVAQNNQKNTGSKKQNTAQSSAQSKKIGQQTNHNLVNTLQHDTCLNRKFSIVFYVVLDSSYQPGQANNTAIAEFMDSLNSKFKRICVKFENCSTVYIPNHSYGEWYRPTTDTIVTSQWYTEKTINIYLVDSIYQNFPYEVQGYSFGPPASPTVTITKDVIVLEKWQLLINNCVISMHHIGHFFGLLHTHHEINPTLPATPPPPANVASKEFVDGSNCLIHGDGLCDTEADPMGGALKDGKGNYYLSPVDNYMSFSSNGCRFTQQQYNRMAYIMITARKYLH
jgi:hypothetical protein